MAFAEIATPIMEVIVYVDLFSSDICDCNRRDYCGAAIWNEWHCNNPGFWGRDYRRLFGLQSN